MKTLFATLLLGCCAVLGESATPEELLPIAAGQLELAPSFEACSYYFRPSGAAAKTYMVEFRRNGESAWQRGFEPVTDLPTGVWKGSLFNLTEDTSWQVRVLAPDGSEAFAPKDFRTWSSTPRIAKTIDLSTLPAAKEGLVITDQGTPEGWIKYTAPRGWRLERPNNPNDAEAAAITFRKARNVILEGVTIVGGAKHAVLVEESDAVRILNCDISGWGRVGVQQFTNTEARGKYADATGKLINYDAGVSVTRSARTVVERCYIHDPRHRANSWMFSHPAGPTAMHMNTTRGGNVVRWNDFVGSDEHRWNDVIEASSNGSADGGFFRDSDITGNYLAFGNDDGTELEGGGMNVRFYRNKVEGTLCSVSSAACLLGPQFIFENLVSRPGDEAGLALMFFKNSHGEPQGGKRHFINNTLYGPASPYGSYGKPIGEGRIGYMRNNIFVGNNGRAPGDWARRDDFDSDFFWAIGNAGGSDAYLDGMRKLGQEAHGAALEPQLARPDQGDFHLAANSPLRGRAAAVANLTRAGANPGALADEATDIPFRPLSLTATPRELDFGAAKTRSRMQVTVAVPGTANEPVAFEIKKNRVATWFDVQPSSGRVAPGEKLTLTVTVNETALHGRPRYKGAFLVRTANGLSRPVSVYATADFHEDLRPASAPNSAYLEATNAEIDTRFTAKQAGKYSLLIRAAPRDGGGRDGSFTIALDDAKEPARVSLEASYQWNLGATNQRVVYLRALGDLTAGEHRLRVSRVRGAVEVKEFIVTDHPAVFFIDDWQKER